MFKVKGAGNNMEFQMGDSAQRGHEKFPPSQTPVSPSLSPLISCRHSECIANVRIVRWEKRHPARFPCEVMSSDIRERAIILRMVVRNEGKFFTSPSVEELCAAKLK